MREVLLVTIGFSPNVGGIETHFDDLVKVLDERHWKIWVLTYKPITTSIASSAYEERGKNIRIYRIPWIRGIFYRLVNKPLFEFIFLTPGLFLTLPVFLLFYGKNISVIHSHGLVAGFVSVFWGKVFGKRVITTTHSIYSFPEKGIYKEFAKWIFKSSDAVLTLSKQSKEEMVRLGIDQSKVNVFTYWVDLDKFKTISNAKQKLKWENKFIILFVGRLVKEKGILVLLDAVKMLDKNITLAIAGTGPLEKLVTNYQSLVTNLVYLGKVDNDKLPLYYSAADFVIVPSVHEEGFGRVIIEALSCGKPVIASNRGAIPEAMDESVGKLIEITPENIKKAVEYFYYHPQYLKTLTSNSRPYAENKYSENNADMIIDAYY